MTNGIRYSFYDGTLNEETRSELAKKIQNTEKTIVYTLGFKYRRPTTFEVPISKEKAIEIVTNRHLVDVTVFNDIIDINEYSSNDMW